MYQSLGIRNVGLFFILGDIFLRTSVSDNPYNTSGQIQLRSSDGTALPADRSVRIDGYAHPARH